MNVPSLEPAPERLGDQARFRLRIYARTDDGRDRMIYTNSLPRNPEQNQLLIIHTSMGGRPNVLSLSQRDLVPEDMEATRPAPGSPEQGGRLKNADLGPKSYFSSVTKSPGNRPKGPTQPSPAREGRVEVHKKRKL